VIAGYVLELSGRDRRARDGKPRTRKPRTRLHPRELARDMAMHAPLVAGR
jgi:hypothetical protein